jgi:lipopolysaccharide transport system ATP-binding protein
MLRGANFGSALFGTKQPAVSVTGVARNPVKAAIRFEGVSKKFILRRERARSFQEIALDLLHMRTNKQREELWALWDVNFGVAPGEVVALIGPNGAGKSTALKLIARIIEPTSGQVEVSGRVGPLLELGAGFHPDLTGRENIYLNGSILGMRRDQIQQKLDEIVAFAELDRFIDSPVKHYSSGMYVRLGFSVAAHTDPEILLVDEVLAVGDAAFQRKCLTHVDRMRREGVTILLVTHDMKTAQNICQRVIWLGRGRILADGAAEEVIQQYLRQSYEKEAAATKIEERRWGTREVEIEQVRLLDQNGQQSQAFVTGEPLVIEIHYKARQRIERPVFGLAIHRGDGAHITGPNTQLTGYEIPWIEGRGTIRYTVPSLPLLEGNYDVSVSAHGEGGAVLYNYYDYHNRLYSLRVLPSEEKHGMITLGGKWSQGS